jgi:Response regulator containing a CheY-like receiver domain and a GGDEF domain
MLSFGQNQEGLEVYDLPETTEYQNRGPPKPCLDVTPIPQNEASATLLDTACGRSLRVLIVDDNRQIAKSLLHVVGGWGHHACWARSVGRGLIKAVGYLPNVVLVDIALTSMLGYALAQELRLDLRLRACLLVAMRWHSDKRRDACYRQMDFDQFLAKPIDEVVLKALLMREGERLDGSPAH